MEQYKVVLRDEQTELTDEFSFTSATYIIATLAADPRNLKEFETALGRFGPGLDLSWFSDNPQSTENPHRQMIIDLPARLVWSSPEIGKMFPRGEASCRIEKDNSDFPIRYWISDDWKFADTEAEFRNQIDERRKRYQSENLTDFRKVLYGRELSRFLIENFKGDSNSCHASWLQTEREDLNDRSPRTLLLEYQDRVDFDLYSRELQWSFMGTCPPLIPLDSEAFRFAAFGTHEFVVYYDLVRHLLGNFSTDIEEMEEIKARWLETPNEDGPTRIPSEIIESERRRLPLEATATEMMIDEDCPICQMMLAEFDTPTFLHLDSAHFEEGFVFSSYRREDEWLKNRKEWEEFNKRFEENQREKNDSSWEDELTV